MQYLTILCRECGQANFATGDMCAVCGAMLPDDVESAAVEVLPDNSASPHWLRRVLALASLAFLIAFGYQHMTQDSAPTTTSSPVTHTTTARKIPYTVTRVWNLPDGGVGQSILIPPRYAKKKWLKRLGEQLTQQSAEANFSVVEVFDNPKAAQLHATKLYGATATEERLERKYHVGQYIKNEGAQLCAFTAYFDGFGSVNQETYRY